MFEIIRLVFDVCLFKKGPQDLPCSSGLLRILIIIDVMISFLMANISTDWFESLLQAMVSTLLLISFSGLMLYLGRKPERFYQTTSALLGTDTLISFFALPGIASLMIGRDTLFALMVTIALMTWHWAVTGHIIRNALGQTWTFSLGLAFLFIMGSYQVMALLT